MLAFQLDRYSSVLFTANCMNIYTVIRLEQKLCALRNNF